MFLSPFKKLSLSILHGRLGTWNCAGPSALSGSSARRPGPVLGPRVKGGWFLGAGTTTQGAVPPVILVQGPQGRLL